MRHYWVILLLYTISAPLSYAGKILKWTDENGNIHFTDRVPIKANSEEIKIKINSYTARPIIKELAAVFQRSDKIVMYSTARCGYCKKAKRYFKKNRIPFKEYDVEKSNKGKSDYKKLNGKGVPIILIGKKKMVGFSIASFEALYRKAK